MFFEDTIAAIATGMGNAGVGIIRISGKNAIEVASNVFRPAKKEKKSKRYEKLYSRIWKGI